MTIGTKMLRVGDTVYVAAKLIGINEVGGVEVEVAGAPAIFAQSAVRFDEECLVTFSVSDRTELSKTDKTKWISTEDKLPEPNQLILFCVFGQDYCDMGYYRRYERWESVITGPCDETIYFDNERVGFWQPVPKPPKPELWRL